MFSILDPSVFSIPVLSCSFVQGELGDDGNLITVQPEDDGVYSVLIPNLRPGFQYNFSVSSLFMRHYLGHQYIYTKHL